MTVARLLLDGFVVRREDLTEIELVQPKRFGTEECLSVMYGLIFFIVPALMFLAWWRAKPVAVVVVRLKASAPQTDCR